MPLSFSMVDESEPLVDSPLSSPATSPHSSSTDLTALVDNATTTPEQLEPEPEPRTEEGPAAVGVSGLSSPFTSPDIRSCVLSCLTCFELVRLRRVSVDMKQHAEAALESSAVQLGERTAAEWLVEHGGGHIPTENETKRDVVRTRVFRERRICDARPSARRV